MINRSEDIVPAVHNLQSPFLSPSHTIMSYLVKFFCSYESLSTNRFLYISVTLSSHTLPSLPSMLIHLLSLASFSTTGYYDRPFIRQALFHATVSQQIEQSTFILKDNLQTIQPIISTFEVFIKSMFIINADYSLMTTYITNVYS